MLGQTRQSLQRPLIALGLVLLATLIALPTFAADPAPSAKPEKPSKVEKSAKAPEVAITLSGTISSSTDADGKTSYSLASGGKTYQLDAGPSWFHGDKHPLKAFVGKTVTIEGSQRGAGSEIDVKTVDGTALREPGKPPWAGGWKVVGDSHPGWTQEKWDRWQAKIKDKMEKKGVECWPPGHCKKAAPAP